MNHLDNKNARSNGLEAASIEGEASIANNGENDKTEKGQSAKKGANTNQGSNMMGYHTQGVPQDPISEWTRAILERRRYEPYDTTSDITKIRLKVPNFDGRVDPTVFSDWISSIKYFDWYDIMADDTRVKFAKMKPIGLVKVWWFGSENDIRRLGQQPIGTWQEMKAKLQEKYKPTNCRDKLCEQLANLKQGSILMAEYMQKFDELD